MHTLTLKSIERACKQGDFPYVLTKKNKTSWGKRNKFCDIYIHYASKLMLKPIDVLYMQILSMVIHSSIAFYPSLYAPYIQRITLYLEINLELSLNLALHEHIIQYI